LSGGAPILSVRGVSKKFAKQLRRSLAYGLRDMAHELVPSPRAGGLRPGEFWAVDDVSFDVGPGESVAIVGHNGAGKSTLLKMLFGLLKPDRGEIRISGRTEAIIELGTGFTGLLSGRENIEAGAALHGFSSRRTRDLIDRVIDFAELEEFIDAPIQSYSSGMKARLSYALSSQLEPDLLLVDEVLAVGDLAFQRKCVAHMRSYLDGGGALLLVSHNTYQIQSVCRRGLMLERGRTDFAGSAVDTLNHMFEQRAATAPLPACTSGARSAVAIEAVTAQAPDLAPLRTNGSMEITLRYRCHEAMDVAWGFGIWTADQWVCITNCYEEQERRLEPGSGELRCLVPRLLLMPGPYVVRAALVDPATRLSLALFGWNDAGLAIDVRGEASATLNAQTQLNQLVALDVEWQ
jgi:ABC-type polysaccharide/polyol phosphate transport system ATPase subunit